MSNQYGWKFLLDDTVDITDKVKSFTIQSSLDSYCRELSFDTLDELFYDTLAFSFLFSLAFLHITPHFVELQIKQ